MTTVILVIHLVVTIALVGVILLQRSEGGALGLGGGVGSFMSGRAAGDFLTKSTTILATAFFVTSLILAIFAKSNQDAGSILDRPIEALPQQETPVDAEPSAPVDTGPSAPIAR